MGYESKIIPKLLENFVSIQVVCLRFSDSYRFLSSGLDELVKSLDSLPAMDENRLIDEFFKEKLGLILMNILILVNSKNH